MDKYERYNQAIQSEAEFSQYEQEAQSQAQGELSKLDEAEQQLQKNLREAAINNQQYDPREVKKARESIQAARNQINQSLSPVNQERAKLEAAKKTIKTPEQLEAEGYQKKQSGGEVIYYKEDDYKDRGKRKTYVEEEYRFNAETLQPTRFIKRDTYKDDSGDVDPGYKELLIFKNGIVSDYREYEDVDGNDEKEYDVDYDSKGRIQRETWYDDGVKTDKKSYDYDDSTGTVSIETRDYEKERKKAEKALQDAQTIVNSYDVYNTKTGETTTRTLYKDGSFNDVSKSKDVFEVKLKTDQQSGVKTEQYYGKQGDLISTITYTPIKQADLSSATLSSQYKKQQSFIDMMSNYKKDEAQISIPAINSLNPVNQGTDTSNIPQMQLSLKQDTYEPVMEPWTDERSGFRKFVDTISFKEFNQNMESKRLQYISEDKNWQASLTGVAALPTNAVESFEKVAEGFVMTIGGVLTGRFKDTTFADVKQGISESGAELGVRAQRGSPSAITDVAAEIVFDKGLGKAADLKNVLRPAKLTENPAKIKTAVIDNTIKTEAVGSFQIESGLIRRKTKDFSYESHGTLKKVDNVDIPTQQVKQQAKITEQTNKLLSDKPSNTPNTPKQITQQSFSKELADPIPRASKGSTKTKASDIKVEQPSKEIFRGEFETKIRDSKGSIVKTQKLPAELVREGKKQTLFIDGKPYKLKSEVIDTPKGIAIEQELAMSEGAYGLSQKQQTIKTTATDAAGNQRVSLTQKPIAVEAPQGFNFKDEILSIENKPQKRLSDKPQTPGEFVQKDYPITDPMLRAKKKTSKKGPQAKSPKQQPQILEGISMKVDQPKLSVEKSPGPQILDAQITGEVPIKSQTPKQLKGKKGNQELPQQQKMPQIESPAMREERVVAEVFGNDFVQKAKNKPSTDFTPSFDESQIFKEQEQIFNSVSETQFIKDTQNFDIKPNSQSGQQSVFKEPKLKPQKSKQPKEIMIDPTIAADFTKIKMPGIKNIHGASQLGKIKQEEMQEVQIANSQDMSFMPSFDEEFTPAIPDFDKVFKQDSDQGKKQAFRAAQQSKQAQQQDNQQLPGFDMPNIPTPTIPGIDIKAPPPNIKLPNQDKKPRQKKQKDPFMPGAFDPGRYVGSLTGYFQGRTTKKAQKNLTGFEVRPLKIKKW